MERRLSLSSLSSRRSKKIRRVPPIWTRSSRRSRRPLRQRPQQPQRPTRTPVSINKDKIMLASFSTALSALTADETAINVVGNNLANLNTPGFKDTVVSFSDLVTQSIGGNGQTQVGGGVGRPITLTQFSQGAIQS